jgi:hypothetical protein
MFVKNIILTPGTHNELTPETGPRGQKYKMW